jgi:hypothetical protein
MTGKIYKFDVNPSHTHLIIYDDVSQQKVSESVAIPNLGSITNLVTENTELTYDRFRNRIEYLLTRSLTHYKRKIFKLGV